MRVLLVYFHRIMLGSEVGVLDLNIILVDNERLVCIGVELSCAHPLHVWILHRYELSLQLGSFLKYAITDIASLALFQGIQPQPRDVLDVLKVDIVCRLCLVL